MRSFASIFVLFVLAVGVPSITWAEKPSPRALYIDGLVRERALRRDLEAHSDGSSPALLDRVRSLVERYERMSRQHPSSPYMDNALWQGAVLAADAFWTFGEKADKSTALQMFATLGSRFPSSSLVKQSAPHIKRLRAAKPAPPEPRIAVTPPVEVAPRSVVPTGNALTSVRRDVLADALRITLELGQEVSFQTDRLDGPPRVFIDFENTRPADAIKDASIAFSEDVVRKVRIGRQSASRTRVVMDLAGAGRHSIYTLYNPYRVVIDFARAPGATPAVASPPARAVTSTRSNAANVAAATPAAAPPGSELTRLPGPTASTPESASTSATSPTPSPPSVNTSGGFSLSRQLGLGISRVVIDAGHGGHDPGAKTKGLTEAELVLDVALRLEQLLLKHDGFEVVMTRRTDTFVALEERTAIANRDGADLFLSIHANASTNAAARGIETYFLNFAPNRDAQIVAARENASSARSMSQLPDIVKAIALNNKIHESRDFAAMIQSSLAAHLQKTDASVKNLGVKQAPFMVLLGATMPSVLAEISFITHRQEGALLRTQNYRQRIAEALYAGIVRYQQSLKGQPQIAEQ